MEKIKHALSIVKQALVQKTFSALDICVLLIIGVLINMIFGMI